MKKLLALILVALMALPFGIMASAAEVPTEPVATGTKVYTVAADKNPNPNYPDVTPDKFGSAASFWSSFTTGSMKNGGTLVIIAKGYLKEDIILSKTAAPIVFTSVKDGVNYASFNEDGSYNTVDGKGAVGGGQYGSILLKGGCTLTMQGDVIFDNVVVFNRDNKLATIKTSGNLVVKDNVTFAEKTEGIGYTLDVTQTGTAFLHKLGFINYTGKGTIVIGDEIKNIVTADMFGGFEGVVMYSDGTVLTGIPAEVVPGANVGTGNNTPATDKVEDEGEIIPRPSKPLGGGSETTEAPTTETSAPDSGNADTNTDNTNASNDGLNPIVGGILCAVGGAILGAAVTFIIMKKKK